MQAMIWRATVHTLVVVTVPFVRHGTHFGHRFFFSKDGTTEPPSDSTTSSGAESKDLSINSSATATATPCVATAEIGIPDSPVLRSLLPHLVHHQNRYGNPNIPLGSSQGRQCATLRRLRIQKKLSEGDVRTMETYFPNFVWHSLEDVYEQHEFEPLFQRLVHYGGDYSPPKKYPDDPELGAWVTALRRLYKIGKVNPTHVEQLDAIGFAWTTPRQCGSKFMIMYRKVKEQYSIPLQGPKTTVTTTTTNNNINSSRIDTATLQWIRAQQSSHECLSQTRQLYMRELLGCDDWQNWQPPSPPFLSSNQQET